MIKLRENVLAGNGGTSLLSQQRKMHLCKFKTSLVYRDSSRTIIATQRYPVFNPTLQKGKYN